MRQRTALVTTVVVGLILAACGADKTPETLPPTKPVTTVATTTTVLDPVEKAVIDAWIGASQVLDEALNSGDYENHPKLRDFYGPGELLQATKALLADARSRNEKIRYPEPSVLSHDVRVVKIDGITASITDCFVEDSIVFDGVTGAVLNDKVITHEETGELVLHETTNQWRATGRETRELEGVQKCAQPN